MSLLFDPSEYNLADGDNYEYIMASYGDLDDDFIRSESFATGLSSHTKVAELEAGEDKCLKIGAPPTTPGVKVADLSDQNPGHKVAAPSDISLQGDFRRTLRVSGENGEDRDKIGIKLYGGSMNPLNQPAPQTKPRPR